MGRRGESPDWRRRRVGAVPGVSSSAGSSLRAAGSGLFRAAGSLCAATAGGVSAAGLCAAGAHLCPPGPGLFQAGACDRLPAAGALFLRQTTVSRALVIGRRSRRKETLTKSRHCVSLSDQLRGNKSESRDLDSYGLLPDFCKSL